MPLRGNGPLPLRKDDTFKGSMRNLHKNVPAASAATPIATRARKLFDSWLEDPALLRACLDAIGNKDGTCSGPSDRILDLIRYDFALIMKEM